MTNSNFGINPSTVNIMLGSGCFGVVKGESNGENAIKRVNSKIYKNTLNSMREIDILTKVKGSEYCLDAKEITVTNTGQVVIKMEAGVCDANRWCNKRVMLHAALGLEFLHKQNIIHGDVKLSNIIVFDDESAKLIDFGLSIQGPVSGLELELYPEKLRAPEIRNKTEYTTACDVWAFGIALLKFTKVIKPLDYNNNFYSKLKGIASFGPAIYRRIFEEDPKKRATITEVIDTHFKEFSDEIAEARARELIVLQAHNTINKRNRLWYYDCRNQRTQDDRLTETQKENIKFVDSQILESKLPEPVKILASKIALRVLEQDETCKDKHDFIDVCLMIANKYYDIKFRGSKFIVNNLELEKYIVFDMLKGRIV